MLGMTWVSSGILFILASLCATPVSTNCPDVCHCSNFIVRCSGEHVTSVPLGIPADTTQLFISQTSLEILEETSFQNLTSLGILNLSFNKIRQISPGAFEGLSNLTELYLNNNHLQLTNSVYVPGVFRNISNLIILHLNANSDVSMEKNYSYPVTNWGLLPMLRELKIDGLFKKSFPVGFSKLINLENLSTSGKKGHCNIQELDNSTFLTFAKTKLRYLDISYCNLHYVDVLTFQPLTNIETIDLQHQELPYSYMSNIFHGLEHSAIKTLIMNQVCKAGANVVTNNTFKPLQNTKLQRLILSYNDFAIFENNWTLGLPNSLQRIELDKNYIIRIYLSLLDLSYLFFHNLTYLSLSTMDLNTEANNITWPLPLKLETVILSSMHTDVSIPTIFFNNDNSLKKFQMSDATMSEYHGYMRGLDKLEEFIITNVNCRYISTDCFKYMPSLRHLDLSSNYLGDIFSNDLRGEYFRHIETLEVLDISQNMIRYLPELIFANLSNLAYLRLRNNALPSVNASIGHMINLTYLDLAHNSIAYFGKRFIGDLENILQHNNLTIDLSNNYLMCSCRTLSFLNWLEKRKDHFVSLPSYTCFYESNATDVSLKHLNMIIDELDAICRNFDSLVILTATGLIIFFLIPLIGVIHRYRMHLLYWYHVAKRSNHPLQIIDDDNFKYDAFVAFADEDLRFITDHLLEMCERQYGLKLCIHCRDFIPGTPIADNISNAIHCSRKTVIILDEVFIQSNWCMYELSMARMEQIYSGRDTMILVMYKRVSSDHLTLDILEAMRTQVYLEFPTVGQHVDMFWDRLQMAIKGHQI